MATTTASAVYATHPRTVAGKPSVHVLVSGLGTPSVTFTTTALTGADANQDNNNATFVQQFNALLVALRTLGLIETITG